MRICSSLFKCNNLKRKKLFLSFFFQFWNLHHGLNIFIKKKFVIANVFPKLQIVKDLVRPLSKKRRFRNSFDSEDVKGSKRLVKSAGELFYYIFYHSEGTWFGKIRPYCSLKSLSCLLTHWLSIKSMLFRIVIICRFLIKCKHLKNENLFLSFFVLFMELHQILNIFKKRWSS